VTSNVAGTGISISGGTGAVTITNTGVTSVVAGTGVSVSSGTGAVTISIGQSVATSASPTFASITATGTVTASGNGGAILGAWTADATWASVRGRNGYVLVGNTGSDYNVYVRTYHNSSVHIGGNGNNTLSVDSSSASVTGGMGVSGALNAYSIQGNANVAGTGNASHHPSGIYSTGSNWLYGTMFLNANNIGTSGSQDHGANQIYAKDWFRSWGNTGWYNQTHGGGMYMIDSTWVRTYGSKNFYVDAEIRANGSFSSNQSRQRGSYGSITVGSNGRSGDWGGIEFVSPEGQTLMVKQYNYSGMYTDNSTWNWLWNFSTLEVGSDERFKREIEPLSVGLNFIESLEPISYLRLTERTDDDPEATQEGYYYGFTAQNVRSALDAVGETRDVRIHDIGGPDMGLVACTEDAVYDRQYIGITEFIAPMVQAIKELSDKVKALEKVQ
jgi:hypothetical protein